MPCLLSPPNRHIAAATWVAHGANRGVAACLSEASRNKHRFAATGFDEARFHRRAFVFLPASTERASNAGIPGTGDLNLMRLFIRHRISMVAILALAIASGAHAQNYKVEQASAAAPAELSAAVRALLGHQVFRVSGPNGPISEIWLRKT